jgi:hypothetical protein
MAKQKEEKAIKLEKGKFEHKHSRSKGKRGRKRG